MKNLLIALGLLMIALPTSADDVKIHTVSTGDQKVERAQEVPFPEIAPGMAPFTVEVRKYVSDPRNTERLKKLFEQIPKSAHPYRIAYGKPVKDFDLMTWVKKWRTENPQMTATQLALTLAVLEQGGNSALSKMDPRVCSVAKHQAEVMAKNHGQSHSALPGLGAGGEIVSESFANMGPNLMTYARSCADQSGWLQSSGHSRAMYSYHKSFCYDMALSSNGVWYCSGDFSESF